MAIVNARIAIWKKGAEKAIILNDDKFEYNTKEDIKKYIEQITESSTDKPERKYIETESDFFSILNTEIDAVLITVGKHFIEDLGIPSMPKTESKKVESEKSVSKKRGPKSKKKKIENKEEIPVTEIDPPIVMEGNIFDNSEETFIEESEETSEKNESKESA